jgi:hypothetical protein
MLEQRLNLICTSGAVTCTVFVSGEDLESYSTFFMIEMNLQQLRIILKTSAQGISLDLNTFRAIGLFAKLVPSFPPAPSSTPPTSPHRVIPNHP